MDRQKAKELLPIIQAFAEGKEIEYNHSSDGWYTPEEIFFEAGIQHYRIKPEPREFWLHPEGEWVCDASKERPINPDGFIKVVEVLE